VVLVVVLASVVATSPVSATARTRAARASIGAGISGPSTLKASVVARGLAHVAALAQDDDGRIWAATATGTTDDADGVYVIDDDGDARLVIDDVDAPLGLVWLDGALYVARHAGIERYSGYDGTAFAEHHAVLTLPDDVGLVSGLALTPDGRLVTGVSAPCDSCTPTSSWSASIVTVGTDGSNPQVLVHDVRAAVGFAVVPATGTLLATLNQRDDLGARTPGDWLAVVSAGQSWGFPDCYGQGGSTCSGVPEPLAVLGKHAAVSGVAVVTGALASGAAAGANGGAAVAEWMTGKVRLVRFGNTDGSSAATATSFLAGFEHPAPVLMTRDGRLLVGDWATGRIVAVAGASA
jgi:glucose/arabinose dehydrogenase